MNLTDGVTFPVPLIKHVKTRFNQKIKFPRDTKRRIQKIVINIGWNTHMVHILCEIRDGKFLFKGKFLSRLPQPVEISHNWIKKNLKYQKPEFYY